MRGFAHIGPTTPTENGQAPPGRRSSTRAGRCGSGSRSWSRQAGQPLCQRETGRLRRRGTSGRASGRSASRMAGRPCCALYPALSPAVTGPHFGCREVVVAGHIPHVIARGAAKPNGRELPEGASAGASRSRFTRLMAEGTEREPFPRTQQRMFGTALAVRHCAVNIAQIDDFKVV